MAALYVTSPTQGSGKTAICAGLAKQLTAKGKKVGYFKPFVSQATKASPNPDNDAALMQQLLSLSETVEQIRPTISWSNNLAGSLKEAYAKVSQGKDIVIIEGQSEQYQISRDIATALNAKVLVIETYSADLSKAIDGYKRLGQALIGVVLNKAPKNRAAQLQTDAFARLKQAGVALLGVLPEDRNLAALTVGELAQSIGGEFVSGAEQSAQLIENLMLQAFGLDSGVSYFGRKDNKAAILRNDRPDTQLAALETSTKCLVLAGGGKVLPVVIGEAKNKSVAVITAKETVPAVLPKIETALARAAFNQAKLPAVVASMTKELDLQKVYQGLGVA